MTSVLFVCSGNICRSPVAQGVFESLVADEGLTDEIFVDSAGTGPWHVGDPPDERAQQSAKARGFDLSGQRARRLSPEDFDSFDYVLTMDEYNFREAKGLSRGGRAVVRPFLDYAPDSSRTEVPDPYYGADDGFEVVLDLIELACEGLLTEIKSRRSKPDV